MRRILAASSGLMLVALTLGGMSPPAAAAGYSPDPPTNVNLVIDGTTAVVSWTPSTFAGTPIYGAPPTISHYSVYLKASDYSYAQRCTSSGTSCTFPYLKKGKLYQAEVEAFNTSSQYSYAVLSPPVTLCCSIPGAIYTVNGTPGDRQVTVSWEPPSDLGGGGVTYTAVAAPGGRTCTSTETSCIVTGLENGEAYNFSVSAANAAGAGKAGRTYNYPGIVPLGGPSAPRAVKAEIDRERAHIVWAEPANDGGSKILRYVVASQPPGLGCTTTKLECWVSGLQLGTRYTFRVSAVNSLGNGVESAPSTPARLVALPSTPLAVKAALKKTTVSVSWRPPKSDGGTPVRRYVVTASPGGRTCSTDNLACRISGLSLGTTYSFLVEAVNKEGRGPAGVSNRVTTASPPRPPSTPTPSPTPSPSPTTDKPTQPLS